MEGIRLDDQMVYAFMNNGGGMALLESLKSTTDPSLLTSLLEISTQCRSVPGDHDKPMVLGGLFKVALNSLQYGVARSVVLDCLSCLQTSYTAPVLCATNYKEKMLEIINDPNAKEADVKRAFSCLNSSFDQGVTPEIISTIISHLDNPNPVLAGSAINSFCSLVRHEDIKPNESMISKVANKLMQINPTIGLYETRCFLECGEEMVTEMVKLGLIERLVGLIDKKVPHDDRRLGIKESLNIVLKNKSNQLLAFGSGIIPIIVKEVASIPKEDRYRSPPMLFDIISLLLENPVCHNEFVDVGGLKFLNDTIAQYKDPTVFRTLYNIGNANDNILRTLAADPYLNAQIVLVCRKGPPDCKGICLELITLFIFAKIPIHPSLTSLAIQELSAALTNNTTKLPLIKIIQALTILTENIRGDQPMSLSSVHQDTLKILESATGEVRYHAIRLLTNVPESPVKTRVDHPNLHQFTTLNEVDKKSVVEKLAFVNIEAINDEMVEFCLSNTSKEIQTDVLIALAARMMDDESERREMDLFPQLENLIGHPQLQTLIAHASSTLEWVLEGILVFAALIIVPENVQKVVKLCSKLDEMISSFPVNYNLLRNSIRFTGMYCTSLCLLFL